MRGKRSNWARFGACVGLAAISLAAACSSSGSGGKANIEKELSTANQLQQQGKIAAAEALYLKIVKAQPSNFYAQYDLGVIAQGRGDALRALTYYGAALTANPSYVPAMYNEALIYGQTQPATAIALYKRAIAVQPVSPTAYYHLGLLENQRGQVQAGTNDLATAINQDPSLINAIPKHLRGLIVARAAALKASASASPAATPSTATTPS